MERNGNAVIKMIEGLGKRLLGGTIWNGVNFKTTQTNISNANPYHERSNVLHTTYPFDGKHWWRSLLSPIENHPKLKSIRTRKYLFPICQFALQHLSQLLFVNNCRAIGSRRTVDRYELKIERLFIKKKYHRESPNAHT